MRFLSIIVGLQALVVASPQSLPLSTSLTKESTLKTADGHVDLASIKAYISSTEA